MKFHYRPDLPAVFDNASFNVPTGSTTALVARMGGGKTTLFRLLLRFYEIDSGSLEIFGRPVSSIDTRSLRDDVALLSQFPAFTHDSVRDNLRLADPDIDDEKLLSVCHSTGLFDVLSRKIPDTGAGEILDAPFASGAMLSGGQRRLFALTRCLLRDPRILLLDETHHRPRQR